MQDMRDENPQFPERADVVKEVFSEWSLETASESLLRSSTKNSNGKAADALKGGLSEMFEDRLTRSDPVFANEGGMPASRYADEALMGPSCSRSAPLSAVTPKKSGSSPRGDHGLATSAKRIPAEDVHMERLRDFGNLKDTFEYDLVRQGNAKVDKAEALLNKFLFDDGMKKDFMEYITLLQDWLSLARLVFSGWSASGTSRPPTVTPESAIEKDAKVLPKLNAKPFAEALDWDRCYCGSCGSYGCCGCVLVVCVEVVLHLVVVMMAADLIIVAVGGGGGVDDAVSIVLALVVVLVLSRPMSLIMC